MNIEDAKKYIGGHWESSGKLQFDFLLEEGLKPSSKLLDIGMGCGRASRFFIEYLNEGNFYGIEQHDWLVDIAMTIIDSKIMENKRPKFFVNSEFVIDRDNDVKFDYIIAKSVFTHLVKNKISQCFRRLKMVSNKNTNFYFSIFVGDSSGNPKQSDDTRKFSYSVEEITELAEGWSLESKGHKGCYRQTMFKAKLK